MLVLDNLTDAETSLNAIIVPIPDVSVLNKENVLSFCLLALITGIRVCTVVDISFNLLDYFLLKDVEVCQLPAHSLIQHFHSIIGSGITFLFSKQQEHISIPSFYLWIHFIMRHL